MKNHLFLFFLLFTLSLQGGLSEPCAFCEDKVLERQVFYEGELVLVLYTHKPVMPGHCLIIPKRHVERFENLTDEEMLEIGQVIKKVDSAVRKEFHTISYLLLQKNGEEVGQTVPHVHFHYIPRKEGEDSSIAFMLKMLIANLKTPLSSDEMQLIVQRMEEGMERESH